MSLTLAFDLRGLRPDRAGPGESFVAGVLGPLSDRLGGTVLLAPGHTAGELARLAPGAEVRPGNGEVSGVDALLCPLGPVAAAPSLPAVATLTDLRHELAPGDLPAGDVERAHQGWRRTAGMGAPVLTFSDFGRRALVESYGFDSARVVVAPLGTSRAEPAGHGLKALGPASDYVLCHAELLGGGRQRSLLRALELLAERGRELTLLVASPTLAGAEELRRDAAGIDHLVRLIGQPPPELAAAILGGARALVEPSPLEVFPVAVGDALAAGTPVVAADRGATAEVAGDAALLVDTDDPDHLAGALERLVWDAELAAELAARGRRRAEGLSWERTADAVMEVVTSATASQRVAVRTEPPLVSVVTPSLNMAGFLGQAVESVLSQDYPRIEYLVMDGGSTDGSVELLEGYGDRLRFVSGPDGGQAEAINRGFRETSGEIFAFLNADDAYLPGAVTRAVRGFLDKPGMAVVYGEGLHVDEEGEPVDLYPTLPFDPEALMRGSFICQPAAFISRSALQRVGPLDTRLRVAMDYDLWIRLSRLFDFAKVDETLATSRMHAKAKTTAIRRTAYREGIALAKRHFGYVPLDWLDGYTQFLIEGTDQFYARSRPSARSRALALLMGMRHNPRRFPRFWREWATDAGLRHFQGRWDDGWISRHYVDEIRVPGDCSRVRVAGRHEAGISRPLELSVHLEGSTVARLKLPDRDRFEITGDCPPHARGHTSRLEILANRTWVPRARGDRRRVSCVIDSITLE
jgi:glycosyltransferase involved in cell wall biosynthesis